MKNDKNQRVCSGINFGYLVRDGGKYLPGIGTPLAINNNGRIITNYMEVLDYEKDALPSIKLALEKSGNTELENIRSKHRSDLSASNLASPIFDNVTLPHRTSVFAKTLGIPTKLEPEIKYLELTDSGYIAIVVPDPKNGTSGVIIRGTPGGNAIAKAKPKPNQCSRYQEMLDEAKDLNWLAGRLEKDYKAYLNKVIDIIIKGYDSPLAVIMLDIPSKEIPEYFKDEQQIIRVRPEVIARIRAKAKVREQIANIGISGNYMPQSPIYSKENVTLFCTHDVSKYNEDFVRSMWMAGYIDYEFFTELENEKTSSIPEILSDIATVLTLGEPLLERFAVKVLGEKILVNRLEVKASQELVKKELPKAIEVVTLPPLLDKAITKGMELNPTKNAVFRGGNSFKVRFRPNGKPLDVDLDPNTGLVRPLKGVSLDANPVAVEKFGGAYQIKSIPNGLKIIQRGENISHFEIVPKAPMSVEQYENLLNQITFF